jgi:RNA polymerase-binding transcription factor DksA
MGSDNEAIMAEKTKKRGAKLCTLCGAPIPAARVEALPGVTMCIECAKKNPPKVDASKLDLSQASPIDRTGFAPTD